MLNIILVVSEGCCGCKIMKRNLISIADKLEDKDKVDISFVELNSDTKDFIKSYNITDVPTTLFLDEDDTLLHVLIGNKNTIEIENIITTLTNG